VKPGDESPGLFVGQVDENPSLLSQGKYDVSRLPSPTREPMKMLAA
jgi:hypothetical protein